MRLYVGFGSDVGTIRTGSPEPETVELGEHNLELVCCRAVSSGLAVVDVEEVACRQSAGSDDGIEDLEGELRVDM